MEKESAISAFAALAHDGRLAALRELVRAGDDGLPPGQLARLLAMPANSLSTNLAILARAGLVTSCRAGRSVRYCANFAGMNALIDFLVRDCCQGRAELAETPGDAMPDDTAPFPHPDTQGATA